MVPATMPPVSRRVRIAGPLLALAGLGLVVTDVSPAGAAPSAPVTALAPAFAPQPESVQSNVARYVNAHRRARGLRQLTMSSALNSAAQGHANWMASVGRMSHTGSGGSTVGTRVTRAGYRWSMVGENIAYGQTSSSAVVYAWLKSPPHAANMFNANYTQMGVGVAYRNGTYWWCLVVARPG